MIRIEKLYKHYQLKDKRIPVLRGVSCTIAQGELVALMGPSGSGKSTLLNIMAMLDVHDAGTYILQGHTVEGWSENQRSAHRNALIGFIFQHFHLIAGKTALYNTALPLYYQGVGLDERNQRAQLFLERVGLAEHVLHKPHELSGGQQQRVAIARALVADPPLILADEPTGALDSRTSKEVMSLIKALHQEGKTVVIVTHDEEVAAQCSRRICMRDGVVV